MDSFVKNFIVMSIVYLALSSVFGIAMLADPVYYKFRFVHSHLNLLGWVSMMIYGVGYHILPRFAGKKLKSLRMGEVQFYLANIGLVGMVVFYSLKLIDPENSLYSGLAIASGIIETVSISLFFYNMIATFADKQE